MTYIDQFRETLDTNCGSNGILKDNNFNNKDDCMEKSTNIDDPDTSSNSSQSATFLYRHKSWKFSRPGKCHGQSS